MQARSKVDRFPAVLLMENACRPRIVLSEFNLSFKEFFDKRDISRCKIESCELPDPHPFDACVLTDEQDAVFPNHSKSQQFDRLMVIRVETRPQKSAYPGIDVEFLL